MGKVANFSVLYQLNAGKDGKAKRYFAAAALEDDQKHRRRTVVSRLRDGSDELIKCSCKRLSGLYNPLDYLGQPLSTVQKEVRKKVRELLEQVKRRYGLLEGRGSAEDYVHIMISLFDGYDGKMPSVIPRNAESVFANIAIASPASCAYRLFLDHKKANDFASNFVALFYKSESTDILDVLYGKNDDFYYEDVLRYCAEGNLQAVLDEWAFVLGLKGDELFNQMKNAFTDAVNIQVDTLESFTGKSASKPRMRNHFAVGYFNARLDDKNVQRTEKIRTAFNSPLLPFVLATTSIGQEGLDFHLYCRKVFHWNLPSNPVDLEQREGRVNRYMGLAIRQSIANKYGTIPFKKDVWQEMMGQASLKENGIIPTLSPTGVCQTIAVTM